jgi:hypothetical protein
VDDHQEDDAVAEEIVEIESRQIHARDPENSERGGHEHVDEQK